MTDKIFRTDKEWQDILTPQQYKILRKKGTERAFTGKYHDSKEKGTYQCAACGNEVFISDTKFDSGSGWPSFYDVISQTGIQKITDKTFFMTRTEVACSRCNSHLGHVFKDGPKPTGLRYCINSAALNFAPKTQYQKASFAAGCFWSVQAKFDKLPGVKSTTVGYTGSDYENPTYQQVCSDKTGHAEAVEILYDPNELSYEKLLNLFWTIHNPTTLNRQGPDIGTQYRSAIFYHTPEQKAAAEKSIANHQAKTKKTITTQIQPAKKFYPAEKYHQKYIEKQNTKKKITVD